MDPVPDAFALPATQIVVDRLPGRQVVGQSASCLRPEGSRGSRPPAPASPPCAVVRRARPAGSAARSRPIAHRSDRYRRTAWQAASSWHRQRLTRSIRPPMNHAETAKGILLQRALRLSDSVRLGPAIMPPRSGSRRERPRAHVTLRAASTFRSSMMASSRMRPGCQDARLQSSSS